MVYTVTEQKPLPSIVFVHYHYNFIEQLSFIPIASRAITAIVYELTNLKLTLINNIALLHMTSERLKFLVLDFISIQIEIISYGRI